MQELSRPILEGDKKETITYFVLNNLHFPLISASFPLALSLSLSILFLGVLELDLLFPLGCLELHEMRYISQKEKEKKQHAKRKLLKVYLNFLRANSLYLKRGITIWMHIGEDILL